MPEPISGIGAVTPQPPMALRPFPDLRAEAAAAIQRLEAEDCRPAQHLPGTALPTLSLAAPITAIPDMTPNEWAIKALERPGQGSLESVRLTLGRPLLLRPDGMRMGLIAAGYGAIGPSNLPSGFVSARGHLALHARLPDPAGGFDRFFAVGPAIGIDGDTTGRALTIRSGGVGGHVETGIAIPLPVVLTKVELGAYADVLSDRQEGGLLLRFQTGK
jgi:hypothetical protein